MPVGHRAGLTQVRARVGHTGAVPQHMADGDLPLAVVRELGPVRRHRIVQVEQTGLDELVDHDRDVRLARGEEPEQRVRRTAEAPVDHHLPVAEDTQLGDRATGLDQLDRLTQAGRVQPDVLWFARAAEFHRSLPRTSLPCRARG